MSQYPGPYTPPQFPPPYAYAQYPATDLLGPAKRASVLMYVIGGLMVFFGICCGVGGLLLPWDEVFARQPELSAQNPEMTPEVLRIAAIVIGGLMFLFGVPLIVLAMFVRRGSAWPAITALVLIGIFVLLQLGNLVGSLVEVGGNPQKLAGLVCGNGILLALFGLLVVWLIQAIRAAGQVRQMQANYQAQYWQYQQQAMAYQQAAGTYAAAPMQPPASPPAASWTPAQPPPPSAPPPAEDVPSPPPFPAPPKRIDDWPPPPAE